MENVRLSMSLLKDMNQGLEPVQSDYAVFCAVGIYMFYKEEIGYDLIPKVFYNKMLGKSLDSKVESKYINNIKLGLEELRNKGWIAYDKIGKYYSITSSKIFYFEQGSSYKNYLFFTVPLEYINKVLRENNGIKLLHHYLYLMSTINLESGVGFANRETIAYNLHIKSLKTVTQRNKKLIELGVIVFKERKNQNSDGTWNTLSNIYSLPENNLNLIKYSDKEFKTDKEIYTDFSSPDLDIHSVF